MAFFDKTFCDLKKAAAVIHRYQRNPQIPTNSDREYIYFNREYTDSNREYTDSNREYTDSNIV